jgi:hypothetical protein
MGDCAQFGPLREAFADGQIESDDAARLREHLAECPGCRRELRDRAALRRDIQRITLPEAPRELVDRIRTALDAEDRRGIGGRFARWPTVAAAALAAALLLSIVLPAGASVPRVVRQCADLHDRIASGADLARALDATVFRPAKGECVCAATRTSTAAPWILYRCSGTPVSALLLPDDGSTLPRRARRTHDGREYHAFRVGDHSVLCFRAGGSRHLWIARLDEAALLKTALSTPEGRRAFSGEALSMKDVTCRLCCQPDASPGASLEMLIAEKELDLDRVLGALGGRP